jgi:hypothetical protein
LLSDETVLDILEHTDRGIAGPVTRLESDGREPEALSLMRSSLSVLGVLHDHAPEVTRSLVQSLLDYRRGALEALEQRVMHEESSLPTPAPEPPPPTRSDPLPRSHHRSRSAADNRATTSYPPHPQTPPSQGPSRIERERG